MLVEWAEGMGGAAAAEWPVAPEEGPYWAALVVKQGPRGQLCEHQTRKARNEAGSA